MDSEQAISAELQRYMQGPPARLAFAPALERDYAEARRRQRREAFPFDVMAGLIALNLGGLCIIASAMLSAGEARNAYLCCQILVTLPELLLLAALQRFPKWRVHGDVLSTAILVIGVGGLIAINRVMSGNVAVYEAFVMACFPVRQNLLEKIPIRSAAPMALLYLPALIANVATRPDFSYAAAWFVSCLYVIVSGMTLAANFRMEAAERLNYLGALQAKLRNAQITQANLQLDLLSRRDALTGLSNRRDFNERFAQEVERSIAQGRPLAVLMIDIDHFKLYNDSLGHAEGDRCIREIAQALARSVGEPPHFAGRLGGEEFAVVLPGLEAGSLGTSAAAARAAVQALKIRHPGLGDRRCVSVSLGAACLNPACPETPEALLARADDALYRAKRAGRDRAEIDLKAVCA